MKMLDNLNELYKKCEKLSNQFAASMEIAALIPGAFDHGSVKTQWISKTNRGLRGVNYKHTLKITLGNGEEHLFDSKDVPEILHTYL